MLVFRDKKIKYKNAVQRLKIQAINFLGGIPVRIIALHHCAKEQLAQLDVVQIRAPQCASVWPQGIQLISTLLPFCSLRTFTKGCFTYRLYHYKPNHTLKVKVHVNTLKCSHNQTVKARPKNLIQKRNVSFTLFSDKGELSLYEIFLKQFLVHLQALMSPHGPLVTGLYM